jgi:hypothetical protein
LKTSTGAESLQVFWPFFNLLIKVSLITTTLSSSRIITWIKAAIQDLLELITILREGGSWRQLPGKPVGFTNPLLSWSTSTLQYNESDSQKLIQEVKRTEDNNRTYLGLLSLKVYFTQTDLDTILNSKIISESVGSHVISFPTIENFTWKKI